MNEQNRPGMRIMDRPEYRDKQRPLTATEAEPVIDAVKAMCGKNYGSVVVTNDADKVEGILTERDIMIKIVRDGLDPAQTKVGDIMTRDVRVAHETDDVANWLRIMSNERFRRLPVVDDAGRIKAVFTQGDFVSYTWPELMYQAGQFARASISRNLPTMLIAGGIMVYTLLILIVFRLV